MSERRIEHRGEVTSSFVEGGYTAKCSCGWASPRLEVHIHAWDAWRSHLDALSDHTEGET